MYLKIEWIHKNIDLSGTSCQKGEGKCKYRMKDGEREGERERTNTNSRVSI